MNTGGDPVEITGELMDEIEKSDAEAECSFKGTSAPPKGAGSKDPALFFYDKNRQVPHPAEPACFSRSERLGNLVIYLFGNDERII